MCVYQIKRNDLNYKKQVIILPRNKVKIINLMKMKNKSPGWIAIS